MKKTLYENALSKAIALIGLTLLLPLVVQAQTIKGKVTDAGTGEPLVGVTILEENTSNGTVTDLDGAYSLTLTTTPATLVFAYVGYDRQSIPYNNQSIIDVAMKAGTQLQEIVVTAMGIEKQKEKLGFSVTELKGAQLAESNEINPINALSGRVAGVQIDQGAGGLFGNSKILIRGNSTLSKNNQPIIVIDGVILDNDISNVGGRDYGNDLKNLNTDDFASVSVLKGSAAAALYGSRAINGVILITTKKGHSQKGLGVDASQTVSVYDAYKGPDFQNEYGGGTVGAFFTDRRDPNYKPSERWVTKTFPTDPVTGKPYIDQQIGRELENWGPKFANQPVTNYDGTPTTYHAVPSNYLDAFQTGRGLLTHVALNGGSEKGTFRLSYTHNDSKGVVPKNHFDKNAFSLRSTYQISPHISADVSVSYTLTNAANPPNLGSQDAFASGNFGKAYTWVFPRNYDTKYWMQPDKYISQLGGVVNPSNPDETNKVPGADFWYTLFENDYNQKEGMLLGRIALTFDITSWAKLILEGNISNINSETEVKELGKDVGFEGGKYSLDRAGKNNNFLKWLFQFNRDVGSNLSINGYFGGETQHTKNSFLQANTVGGLNYPGNFFIGNSKNPQEVNGGLDYNKEINSLYASVDLDYKSQLYLQGTWRGDWSSALTYLNGSGNNFFNYPGLSASWVFTETLHLPSFIEFGKLRANIAALGKDTDPFTLNPGYVLKGFANINGQSIPLSTFSSDQALQLNLKPERKIAKEVGLEMQFLKNRLGFDFSYYQDNTHNQILPISVPQETGIGATLINAGNIQNKGIELSINATPVKANNFEWSTLANFSRNRNKIISLHPDREEYDLGINIFETSVWAIVGKSYGVIRSRIHSKPFQATNQEGNPVDDPRNGMPILSWRADARAAFPARSNELMDLGDINPDFLASWNNDFTYKNFSLNVLIDAKFGGDFVSASYRLGTHTGVLPNTLAGRDPEHGGITWTSKYDGQTYDDGVIVDGVFAPGQMVAQPDGSQVDVGGMSFKEAYDKGYVEPTHAPQFYYRNGSSSTGVADLMVWPSSWIALRQVALSYRFPQTMVEKLKLTGLSVSIVGRDLGYLRNTLPFNINPASNISNSTASAGEYGFLPMIRSFAGTVRISF